MKTTVKFLLATSALAACVPNVAIAQDDEIIITATRRAESIQDVPIAVTAVLPETLEKQGVVNIQNLTSVAPSFSTSNAQIASGSVVLRVRGVGTTSNNIGFESAVGVFIDGAYQSRPGVALGEFVDVERVEVLRGPQGTLFGRNTSAGALNITNKAPVMNETEGFVNATYGNHEHMSLQGAINIPLVDDTLAARLTGAIRERDGYIDIHDRTGAKIGESNGISQMMLRGQLGFETSNLNGRIIADYSEADSVCCSAVELLASPLELGGVFNLVGLGPRGGMTAPNVAANIFETDVLNDALDDRRASSSQVPNPSMDQIGITAELEYNLSDSLDLVYVGSYRQYDASEEYDSGFSGLDIFNVLNGSSTEIDTMTHELRLQGDAMDGKLDWLVGGYYSDEDIAQSTKFGLGQDYGELIGALFGNAFGPNPLTLLSGGVDPSVVRATNNYAQNSESFSVFTHNIFDVTEDLSVTLGARYSDESKTGGFNQTDSNNPLCTNLLAGVSVTPGGLAFAGVPPQFFGSVLGTGCFAFTAPADLPQAFPGFLNAPFDGIALPLPRSFNEEFSDSELIYTGKLSYNLGDASVYGGFTHGYKSGGFNLDSTAAAGGADPRFASEEVDAYEIGIKSKLADGRITLNVAGFYEDFSDFQVLEFTGAQFQTFNVPQAISKGIEVETFSQLSDNFDLTASVSYTEAEYPDDCAPTTAALRVQNLCGFSLTNAPKWVGLLGANYENNLNENIDYFLSGQMRFEDDRRTSTQGRLVPATAALLGNTPLNPFDIQQESVKINMRGGLIYDNLTWEAWVTNLTDEVTRGVTFNTVLRSGSRSAFLQEGRMFGSTLRYKF